MSDSKTQLAYQEAARRVYDEASITIESTANVMAMEDGAFVNAWLWVPKEALEDVG